MEDGQLPTWVFEPSGLTQVNSDIGPEIEELGRFFSKE